MNDILKLPLPCIFMRRQALFSSCHVISGKYAYDMRELPIPFPDRDVSRSQAIGAELKVELKRLAEGAEYIVGDVCRLLDGLSETTDSSGAILLSLTYSKLKSILDNLAFEIMS